MLTATRKLLDEFASLQSLDVQNPVTSIRASEARVLQIRRDVRIHHATFNSAGNRLAVGCEDGRAWLCDVVEGWRHSFLLNSRVSVRSVAFVGNGDSLAVAGGNWLLREGEVAIWTTAGSGKSTSLWRHNRPVTALAATQDGSRLVAGSGDGILRSWDSDFASEQASVLAHEDEITSIAFVQNGRFLATAGADRAVRIWDANLKPVRTLKGHERVVRGIACSSDQKWLASADEQTILIWDIETGRILHRREAPCGVFRGIVFSPQSRTWLTAGNSLHSPSEIRLWRHPHPTGKIVIRHRCSLTTLAISPDASTLAIADDRGAIHLWANSADDWD